MLVLKSKQTWLVALCGGLMISIMFSLGALWGEKYFMDIYNISLVQAAARISLLYLGFALGAPACGLISDYIGRRKPVLTVGIVGVLICFVNLFYITGYPAYFDDILLFLTGSFTGFLAITFPLAREFNLDCVSATAMGFVNLVIMLLGALGQTIVGIILDFVWSGGIKHGARVYSHGDYKIAFCLFLFSLFSAFILSFFIHEP